jgi:soluble lytic murein transglycosylase
MTYRSRRMLNSPRKSVVALAGLFAFTFGVLITTLMAADDDILLTPRVSDIPGLRAIDPVRALPRTEEFIALEEGRANLGEGRPWNAWHVLRDHAGTDASPVLVLTAAEAALGWGAHEQVTTLLEGRPWLDRAGNGEGWYLMGRAYEARGQTTEAIAAYQRFSRVSRGEMRAQGLFRLGRLMHAEGNEEEASRVFAALPTHPVLGEWAEAFAAEAGRDPARAGTLAVDREVNSGPAVARRVSAEVAALAHRGDRRAALAIAEREQRRLEAAGALSEAGALIVVRARILVEAGATNDARPLLRTVAGSATVAPAIRREAADLLAEAASSRTAAEELARADAYQAAGESERAAAALRAAISQGAPDPGALRMRLGHLLFSAREYGPAQTAFTAAERSLAQRDSAASAALFAARSRFRAGQRSAGEADLRAVTERYSGTAAAGSAHFLLGDLTNNVGTAISHYRRAAAIPASPDAQEAHFRWGDRLMSTGDRAAAMRVWEDFLRRYDRGEVAAQTAYALARMHDRAGDRRAARRFYQASVAANPISYYAMRAAYHGGIDPFERVRREAPRWDESAEDAEAVGRILARMEALERMGLLDAREEEYRAARVRFEGQPYPLLLLAEGLIEQGHAPEAMRLGRRIQALRNDQWDDRLLRVVFPLPYRAIFERETSRYNVDMMLLAGLVRQESLFQPAVASWVGAAGLAQVMPATGAWLAPQVGIADYSHRLLEVPEVSLRLGAFYMGYLLRRYNGSKDLALAGYNAGPARADRWRTQLGYGRVDIDDFRESIPFDETRHYVKIVTRNAAVYEALYGEGDIERFMAG